MGLIHRPKSIGNLPPCLTTHRWSSYSPFISSNHIRCQTNISLAKANDSDTNTRAIFVLAAKEPPYCVYGNPFYNHAGFINVFSVNPTGGLDKSIQNAPLDEKSAIHGMVFDSTEEYLYSADMWMNKIWCHKKASPTIYPRNS
jgi:carboxy-cis,cis-muconate cyclase